MTRPFNTVSTKKARLSKLKRYLKDNSGISAMMTAITFPALLLVAGVAIDTAIVTREQPIFYQAVDNAALAVASNELSIIPDNLSASAKAQRQADMEAIARKFLESNYRGIVDDPSSLDLELVMTGQRVDIDVKLEIPTTISSLFGIDKTTLNANTTVMRAMRPVEISFVLDTTGSMADDMTALKQAANTMLSTLYADPSPSSKNMTSPFIRAALVPFSAAVRLDTAGHDFSMDWIDTTGVNPLSRLNFNDSTWNNYAAWGKLKSNATTPNPPMQWNGCVESRIALAPDGANYISSDIAPDLSNPHSLFPAYFNPDSPSWYAITSSDRNRWHNASGSSQGNGNWNNNYIGSYVGYSSTTTNNTSLLAPSGSRRTTYDDSTIGNRNTVFSDRWKNVAKYDGKVLTPETLTANGNGWTQNQGPWYNCTISKVVPLTHQRAKIEAGIASMKASGNTNIAEGLAWGMRTISPGAPFTQVEGAAGIDGQAISQYNSPRWQKYVLLMSDGENNAGSGKTDTGTSYNSLGGSTTPTTNNYNRYGTTNISNVPTVLNTYTSQMCTALKANGVTVYTVGFRVDNPVLRNCATSPAHYKFASTTTELVAYFNNIGQDVLNKMVYIAN